MSSQMTFQSILGKFSAGIEILKGIVGYNPLKSILQITQLEKTKTDAEAANAKVLTAASRLQNLRNQRRAISFSCKEADTNCIENLIRNIASYIKAELGSKHTAFIKIDSILKKFKPPKEKKEEIKEGEVPKKSISQSEKSYESLVGFATDVYTVISELGASYNPSNTNLAAANFKTKVDELTALNAEVIKAESAFGSAVQERYEIYNGEVGINSIVSSVKNYLASLEGGKNNPSYKAYLNAVK